MIAVIQRVRSSSVAVRGKEIAKIGRGLLVLLGVARGDTTETAEALSEKIVTLRILSDQNGKMNRSILETGEELLVVSQFTLVADTNLGRRPSFARAAKPDVARACYEAFVSRAKILGVPTQTGRFGASMQVSLVNDGPVTIIVQS